MNERVKALRGLEPRNAGRGSYLAILEATAGLFGQFPAEDITLRDILSIAGVSNQTLYNYFPNGRDDVALALYDRYQQTMVEDFNHHISLIKIDEYPNLLSIINKLSACLGRAVFGSLRASYRLQATLFEYLTQHQLLSMATHTDELEAALAGAMTQHLGDHFEPAELPRLVRLSVRLVREIGGIALESETFGIDPLESNARLLVRTLLKTGLRGHDGNSGDYHFRYQEPGGSAIVGAPISPMKKQTILERILKRKGRG